MKSGTKIILLLGDGIILYAALFATLVIRYGTVSADLWLLHFMPFSLVFGAWIIALYIDDLYELSFGQRPTDLLVRLSRVTAIIGALAVIFFYVGSGRLFTITPQRVLLGILVFSLIGLYLWRLLINMVVRSPKVANGVLLIGNNELTNEILGTIKQNPHLGLRVAGIIPTNGAPTQHDAPLLQTDFHNLKQLCLDKKIGIIVSTIHPRENPQLLENLFDCIPLKIEFFDATTFYEKITGKIPVAVIEHIWFLENLAENKKNFYERTKRVIDIILGVTLLTISLPFLPLIALVVKMTSRGPVLFYQRRMGKNSTPFSMVKFRTMVTTAEASGPQWAVKNDNRITPIGKFLRKTRLDEIPQLLNVLIGDMSLIGPRPERPEFVDELQQDIPFYKQRLLVKPGLTGWAQVMGPSYGGSKEGSLEKLQYDLFYIKNRSLSLDLSITLKTIRTVLSFKGQ